MIDTFTMGNRGVFIDSSALIALIHPGDQFHSPIKSFFERSEEPLGGITSNLILAEFLSFFARHGNLQNALRFHETLLKTPSLKIVWIGSSLHKEAAAILSKYADQRLSFTDAASFAIMKDQGLARALTFDEDFRKAGFQSLP